MRRLLQKWFKQPVIRLADKYSSRPDAARVHTALTDLYNSDHRSWKEGIDHSFRGGNRQIRHPIRPA
jgi:hypothetical protein